MENIDKVKRRTRAVATTEDNEVLAWMDYDTMGPTDTDTLQVNHESKLLCKMLHKNLNFRIESAAAG